jgi:hypothetical protein
MAPNSFPLFDEEPEPRLHPPIYRWQEDMPENSQPQLVPPRLVWVNQLNDIWLEIPRYSPMAWGGMFFLAMIMFFIMLLFLVTLFMSLEDELSVISPLIFGGGVFFSWFIYALRVYFFEPRDQPVRFNRKRQKIYIFEYKRRSFLPWWKWPTTIHAFDWADVHGEVRFSSDHYSGGYQLFFSVCQPGTYNVIERFKITGGSPEQFHQLWSYLCLYMKHEPVPQDPEYPGRPDNWSPRKADRWPSAMEQESTTAPQRQLAGESIPRLLK